MPDAPDVATARQTYAAAWQQALDAKPDAVVIDSWNDFTHGTEIAASRQYGERYADDTRLATIASTATGSGTPSI